MPLLLFSIILTGIKNIQAKFIKILTPKAICIRNALKSINIANLV